MPGDRVGEVGHVLDHEAEHGAADDLWVVVEQPDHRDTATKALRELRTADDQPLDPDQHAADCPGHVTWLIIDRGVRYYDDTDDERRDEQRRQPSGERRFHR